MNALRAASLCLALPLLAACGDATAEAAFSGSVDTLANGAVHVKNPAAGMWKEGEGWRLVEELRIGREDGTGPDVFGQIAGLEVDAAGRVYVLEGQAKEIRVFGEDGRHVRTVGREGAGPGEMKGPVGLQWDPRGRLWVLDQGNTRFSVFDTAGTYVTSHRREGGFFTSSWSGGITDQGDVYAAAPRRHADGRFTTVLVRADSLAQGRDTVELPSYDAPRFEHERRSGSSVGRVSTPVPFAPGMRWVLDRQGRMWAGSSDRYRVARFVPGGDTTLVVERAWEPAPVSGAERDRSVEGLKWFTDQGGEVDLSLVPGSKPAFHRFVVDDRSHLWVLPQLAEAEDRRALDVFDAEGRFLGRIASPAELSLSAPLLIRGARIHTVVHDEMDIPYVVRFRIEGREP